MIGVASGGGVGEGVVGAVGGRESEVGVGVAVGSGAAAATGGGAGVAVGATPATGAEGAAIPEGVGVAVGWGAAAATGEGAGVALGATSATGAEGATMAAGAAVGAASGLEQAVSRIAPNRKIEYRIVRMAEIIAVMGYEKASVFHSSRPARSVPKTESAVFA